MLRTLLLLLAPITLAGALWSALPTWLPDLGADTRSALTGALFILLCAGIATLNQGRRLTLLRGELDELQARFHDTEEDLLWARRELQSLLEALRTQAANRSPAPERALNEARAEVRLLKSVATQLDKPQRETASPAKPTEAAPMLRPETLDGEGTRQVASPDPARALTAVREALKHDRIDLVLQPVVSLPQRRRRFYECFSRLRDAEGRTLLPKAYIAVAERAGLMAAIDNMLLLRCIQLVRRIQKKGERVGFICNLSPNTLRDTEFFGDFVDYLDANLELAPSLIFEMSQADFAKLDDQAEDYLERLWQLGAGLSIDGVRDLEFDAAKLAARRVGLIKISANALLDSSPQEVIALRRSLAQAEIDLIVERIETDAQLVELLELGIDYGQGYLFGEPRPARLAA